MTTWLETKPTTHHIHEHNNLIKSKWKIITQKQIQIFIQLDKTA